MLTVTSTEAQTRFGDLIQFTKKEPVRVTHQNGAVVYIVDEQLFQELVDIQTRRSEAASWYRDYQRDFEKNNPNLDGTELTEEMVNDLVHELR